MTFLPNTLITINFFLWSKFETFILVFQSKCKLCHQVSIQSFDFRPREKESCQQGLIVTQSVVHARVFSESSFVAMLCLHSRAALQHSSYRWAQGIPQTSANATKQNAQTAQFLNTWNVSVDFFPDRQMPAWQKIHSWKLTPHSVRKSPSQVRKLIYSAGKYPEKSRDLHPKKTARRRAATAPPPSFIMSLKALFSPSFCRSSALKPNKAISAIMYPWGRKPFSYLIDG